MQFIVNLLDRATKSGCFSIKEVVEMDKQLSEIHNIINEYKVLKTAEIKENSKEDKK